MKKYILLVIKLKILFLVFETGDTLCYALTFCSRNKRINIGKVTVFFLGGKKGQTSFLILLNELVLVSKNVRKCGSNLKYFNQRVSKKKKSLLIQFLVLLIKDAFQKTENRPKIKIVRKVLFL